jgi:hypothetical protein
LAREQAMEQASNIFVTVKDVINLAKAQGITSIQASNKLAEARIEAVAGVKRFHL